MSAKEDLRIELAAAISNLMELALSIREDIYLSSTRGEAADVARMTTCLASVNASIKVLKNVKESTP